MATHLEKVPQSLKRFLREALGSNEHFHVSETREAFATFELLQGSDVRARKIFRAAWIRPAKSVISHSEWILRERLRGLGDNVIIDFNRSAQAMSGIRIARMEFEDARPSLKQWAFEEPYSIAPYMQLSWIESVEEKFEAAVQTIDRGLVANPKNWQLHNNKTFALLRLGKVAEAAESFEYVKVVREALEDVACMATHGLLLMHQGDLDGGRKLYGEAVSSAVKRGDRRLGIRAALNYLVSEFDVTKTVDPGIVNIVSRSLRGFRDSGVLAAAEAFACRMERLRKGDVDPLLREAAERFLTARAREQKTFEAELKMTPAPAVPVLQDADESESLELDLSSVIKGR